MTKQQQFAKLFKSLRLKKGFSQAQLAMVMGYGTPQLVSNLERSISYVPEDSLLIYADLFELKGKERKKFIDLYIELRLEIVENKLKLKWVENER